ncbi:hypothetical protein H310_07132 [Aphanomyces invadans]|uniref:Uncharacterized protein n=1 Tax=Aphanomyces invadans TaxID=157072 RepID=A0A024U2S2_9STRA|nr:hypothetical protein H310_07132 [Aphanomyces invadans]ETW00544.1 hypothetical protein H310_07132 [Aphanomyces invadans]|eukprot:XP_008870679.1 hypothetical protein H310_07132 [Aphanomyces invadans]
MPFNGSRQAAHRTVELHGHIVAESEMDSLAHIQAIEARVAVQHVVLRHDPSDILGLCYTFHPLGAIERRTQVAAHESSQGERDRSHGHAPLAEFTVTAQVSNCLTEGGEADGLYHLRDCLKNSVLPTAMCPYLKLGHEQAPVRPQVLEACHMLRRPHDQAAPGAAHLFPCIGPFLSDRHSQTDKNTRMLCPSDVTMCCFLSHGRHDMEGECFAHVVGYNDAFQNGKGKDGGFIVKYSCVLDFLPGHHDGLTSSHVVSS